MSDFGIIQSEADLEKALARIEEIFFAEEGAPEGQELEDLIDKVKAYESARYPEEKPDPVEAVKFMMEQGSYQPEDLVCSAVSHSDLLEVLAGTRSMSIEMASAISKQLAIPIGVLWPHGEPSAESDYADEGSALPPVVARPD